MINQMLYKNCTVRQFINEYQKHFKDFTVYFLYEITPDNYGMYREKNKKYDKECNETYNGETKQWNIVIG